MNAICEKQDCRYYSTYTDTCDFTLINSRARPCPAKNCTEYAPREERRTWQLFTQRRPLNAACTRFIIADCGHEVYSGEHAYTGKDEKSLCPDCVESAFRCLTTEQKAYALGYEPTKVAE